MNSIKARIPEYAKDIKLNLTSVLAESNTGLSQSQIFGIALASTYATRNTEFIADFKTEATTHLSAEQIKAAEIAANLMAMNNIYYRFIHLVSDKSYQSMPAGLRMQAIGNPGIDKPEFELYALAVSAINGCGLCIDSHEKVLRKADIGPEAIQHAIKIAAVVNAVAQSYVQTL